MAVIITFHDLPAAIQSHELVTVMLDGANAKASRVAPCLAAADPAPTEDQIAEARLVLVGAVKRWAEASSGALSTQQAGPFAVGFDTRQRTGFNLWPSEIEALQDICATGSARGRAFEVDTMPSDARTGPREGIAQVSAVTGKTYYSSDLGYLDTDPV